MVLMYDNKQKKIYSTTWLNLWSRKKPILNATCYMLHDSIHIQFLKQHFRLGVQISVPGGDGDRGGGSGQQALTLCWMVGTLFLLHTGQGKSKFQVKCSSMSQPTGKAWLPGQFFNLLSTLEKLSQVVSFSNGQCDIKIDTQVLAWGKRMFIAAQCCRVNKTCS